MTNQKPTTILKYFPQCVFLSFLPFPSLDIDGDHKNNSSAENFPPNPNDVTDLQREKAQVELQMLRLKSNINAIEFQLNHNERVSQYIR